MSYEPTKAQIQQYIPVSNSFVPDNFQSYIRQSEQKWMHKYLSKEEYDAIITANESDEVTDMCHRAVISFAYYLYIPFANVSLSNAGITQTRSETQTFAKEEAVENLRQACYFAGWEQLEAILLIFETTPASFSGWNASTAKTTANELLFTNATDFSRYVNIRELRRVFVLLMPAIRIKQLTRLKTILGKDLYADILSSRSGKNLELLDNFIKPALANLAIAYAIPNISIQLGNYDMALMFDNTGSNKQKSSGKMLPVNVIDYLVQSYEKKGNDLLCLLTDYLVENSDIFSAYGAITPPDISEPVGLHSTPGVIGF
jgi:hypothetical protein